ncbi:MAG: hypothetical protein WCG16_14825, partial [Methylococcales bacterium]
ISIKNLNTSTNATIGKRDAAEPDEKTKLNEVLSKNIVTYKEKLDKFVVDTEGTTGNTGLYSTLPSSASDDVILNEARIIYSSLANSIDATNAEIETQKAALAAEKKKIADQEAAQKAASDKVAFSNWLKTVAYVNDLTENKPDTVAAWYTKLSAESISEFHEKWKADALARNLVDNDNLVNVKKLKSLNSTSVNFKLNTSSNGFMTLPTTKKSSNQKMMLSSPSDLAGDPVVTDFNIVPWANIFPSELSPQLVDNLNYMIQSKLMNKIDDFIQDRAYLEFVIKNDDVNPGPLAQIDNKDVTIVQSLKNVYDALYSSVTASGDNASKILIAGETYDISTPEGTTGASSAIDNIINNSTMYKSTWYKMVLMLKEAGLISPFGALLGVHRGNPFMENMNQTMVVNGERVDTAGASFQKLSKYLISTFTTPNFTPGLQIGEEVKASNQKNLVIQTVIPLVTGDSKIYLGMTGGIRGIKNLGVAVGYSTKDPVSMLEWRSMENGGQSGVSKYTIMLAST